MVPAMKVIGADGWHKGWVTVTLEDGEFERADVFTNIAEALTAFERVSVVGIDIPVGFPLKGRREADVAAKRLLGPRASSVFFAPPRAVLEEEPYGRANELAKERFGFGISAQSYALRNKILEVDRLADDDRIFEVHPEVTFWMLAGGPLPSKKTWDGTMRRRQVLEQAGLTLPDDLGPAGAVPIDDVLDAAAASVSAFRIATGESRSLPDPPERGERGRAMAIWY